MCFLSAKVEFGSLNGESRGRKEPDKVRGPERRRGGGGEEEEGRRPWHFLSTNLTVIFFFLEILPVGWYLAREQGLRHES